MKIQDSGLPLFNVSNGKPLKNADDKIAKYNFLPGPVPPCRKSINVFIPGLVVSRSAHMITNCDKKC